MPTTPKSFERTVQLDNGLIIPAGAVAGTPAAGKVWTATDTDGNGQWAAASGNYGVTSVTQPSRSFGSTYQPSTTEDTEVNIHSLSATGAFSGFNVAIGPNTSVTTVLGTVQGPAAGQTWLGYTFMVPRGWYYKIITTSTAPGTPIITETKYGGVAGGNESWKDVSTNSSTFGTNVGHWGSGRTAQFRKDAIGKVHLRETVLTTGALAAAATLLTMPSGYRLKTGALAAFMCTGSITSVPVTVLDTGVVRTEVALASGAHVKLDPISYFTD